MRATDAADLVEFCPVVLEAIAGRTDAWTADGKIMLLSHTLTMKGSNVASLVEFCPVVKEIA